LVENCRPALLSRHFRARRPATFRQHSLLQLRSEADAINLNRILPILILFYLYINILQLFFINCEIWKFSKIRPMYDKCMTKMITFAADKTS